ncbi:MAG TPA: class I fructose-bisphosphate aldolase [Opitutus sp.]|nr:class I fructose-bisphosphate aldolase [Opitutus sp.]
MKRAAMEAVASELVVPGKGILAADESGGTIEKRFRDIGVISTEETRRAYRELLVTTQGLGAFISGVILYDETIRQKTSHGVSFPELIKRQGMIPGIKVDAGTQPLANFPDERITEGLDGLRHRLDEYARLGARFTKWRAVLGVGEELPTRTCIEANCHALARFAALSQEAGLVPVVEPEVLMDGGHTLARHYEVTEATLRTLFVELAKHRVHLEGLLLKVNMVLSGTTCPAQATVMEAAQATCRCMRRTVPSAVQGIVFLSGGQSDVRATEHLDALNRIGQAPWELSFSFGRALQAPALKTWAGVAANTAAAQAALLRRASCNSAARFGQYTADMEKERKAV